MLSLPKPDQLMCIIWLSCPQGTLPWDWQGASAAVHCMVGVQCSSCHAMGHGHVLVLSLCNHTWCKRLESPGMESW